MSALQREHKGIRLGLPAEMIGYKNRNKGARLILLFEREGIVSDDLLRKLVVALDIDQKGMIQAMDKDRADWEAWVSKSVPMQMIVRLIAAVYRPHPLPAEITTREKTEAYARDFAKRNHYSVCLVLNRRDSVWIGEDGDVRARTGT
ncbi:MAG: hypothetical protein V2B18_13195 [Pseudomonadota bacterium]